MLKELQRSYSYTERISIENNPVLYEQTLKHFETIFQALEEVRKKTNKGIKDIEKSLNQPLNISRNDFDALKGFSTKTDAELVEIRKSVEQTQKLSDELYKLNHTDTENKILDVHNWQGKLLNDESTTADQRELIEQITAERIAQIEEEKENKIAAIRKSANAEFQTDLQNRIAKIDEEKTA